MDKQYCRFREEQIFLVAYILWMIDALIGISMWRKIGALNEFGDYLSKVAYILFVVQFLSKGRYTWKDIAGIFAVIAVVIWAKKSVYGRHIIATTVMIYLSANIDYKKILKCTFVLQSAFMLITILASQVGVIENVIWQEGESRIRYSIGYDYCGYPAHLLLFLTLIWFCLRERVTWLELTIWAGINTVMFVWTDARTDYFLSLLSLGGFYIFRKFHSYKRHKILEFLMKYGCGILAIGSIGIQMIYRQGSGILQALNQVSSNRLILGYQAINDYGFTLFGRVIRWVGAGGHRSNPELVYNYVDCAFLKETLTFGIVFLVILVLWFYWTGKSMVRKTEYMLGWAVFVSLLYAVANAHLCMVTFNVFILSLSGVFREETVWLSGGRYK